MDKRIAISEASELYFPSMSVKIESEIGRGSNSIVYRGSYPDMQSGQLHHVLVKELFPLHPKGLVYRDESGFIRFEEDEEFFEFHRSSFEAGNRVHLRLSEQSPDGVGGNINTFAYNGTFYTVLNFNGGRNLEDEMNANAFSLEKTVKILKGLLLSLGDFHDNGFLHLDIAPDNIMLLGTGERERVMLIDYNSAMSVDSAETRFSIKQGYSAPEVQSGDIGSFTNATDLYSVAAVFLRMIRGYALMPFEVSQRTPPAVSDCDMLRDQPQTVISMVKQILFKGLASSAQRRYSSIRAMMEAFDELEDRIHGVGITHSALWETGKRTVNHLIKNNTALSYLKDDGELFPTYAESSDGQRLPIGSLIDELINGGGNLFVTAPGGMGKTTSMLCALKKASARYSPSSPAVIYIPLHGKSSSNANYITDKVLEHMHFKSDVQNYQQARHALHQLFSKTIVKGGKALPTAVIFLDGLNEITEGIDEIIGEISSLSKLGGIRIYITSRTRYPLEGFSYCKLSPISSDELQDILSRNHLLMPESESMKELLGTPIMLSMFLGLSQQSGKQPSANTADELLDAYIEALIEKEIKALPEDSPMRLKIDVAVHLVLPRIAERIKKSGKPADDATLLREAKGCYKLIKSPIMIKAYPQWIGCKRSILENTEGADDWYDVIVRELLWRRLGMLIKNENGEYTLVHQIVGDYLTDRQRTANKRIARYRAVRYSLVSAVCLLLAATFTLSVALFPKTPSEEPKIPYDTELSKQILVAGVNSYQLAARQYEYIRKLTDSLINDPSDYRSAFDEYYFLSSKWSENQNFSFGGSEIFVDSLIQSGEVFPWSEHSLEKEEYLTLLSLAEERNIQYSEIAEVLEYSMQNPEVYGQYGEEFIGMVSELIELDADITATLYAISCRGAVDAMTDSFSIGGDKTNNNDAKTIREALTGCVLQNNHLPAEDDPVVLSNSLLTLSGKRDDLYFSMQSQGAYIVYITHKGEQ